MLGNELRWLCGDGGTTVTLGCDRRELLGEPEGRAGSGGASTLRLWKDGGVDGEDIARARSVCSGNPPRDRLLFAPAFGLTSFVRKLGAIA